MSKRLLQIALLLLLAWGMFASSALQTVAAGVAVFLFGMTLLDEGFRTFAGGALERVLDRATRTTPRALGFGVVTTTLMQSS